MKWYLLSDKAADEIRGAIEICLERAIDKGEYDSLAPLRGALNEMRDGTTTPRTFAAPEPAAPSEPADDGYRAACIARGWRWYDNNSVLAQLTGHTFGIAHEPTTEGDANENDSIYATWRDCAREALGVE
jgi:hypothetical protein